MSLNDFEAATIGACGKSSGDPITDGNRVDLA